MLTPHGREAPVRVHGTLPRTALAVPVGIGTLRKLTLNQALKRMIQRVQLRAFVAEGVSDRRVLIVLGEIKRDSNPGNQSDRRQRPGRPPERSTPRGGAGLPPWPDWGAGEGSGRCDGTVTRLRSPPGSRDRRVVLRTWRGPPRPLHRSRVLRLPSPGAGTEGSGAAEPRQAGR